MTDQISVEIKMMKKETSTKAIANVTIMSSYGEFTINGFKVIQQEGKNTWVAFPENKFKDKQGEYKSFPIVEAGKTFHRFITELILQKYNES